MVELVAIATDASEITKIDHDKRSSTTYQTVAELFAERRDWTHADRSMIGITGTCAMGGRSQA